MSNLSQETLLEECLTLVKEVGQYIKSELNKVKAEQIEEKELNSLVSYVDKTAEEMLVKKLKELVPESTFITEEQTVVQSEGAYQWIIDPLDGTSNYLHQIPHFAVSLALRVDGVLTQGIVYHIMQDECFHAVKNLGAFLNGIPINVSSSSSLSNSVIATGFPYANDLDTTPLINCVSYWIKNTRGIRRFGAAALDLCYVACGRVDCYYETAINIWDIAAGVLIVEEAGGTVTDLKGADKHLEKGEVVSSNSKIHQDVLKVISNAYQG